MKVIDPCCYLNSTYSKNWFFDMDPYSTEPKIYRTKQCREEFAPYFAARPKLIGYAHRDGVGMNFDKFVTLWRELEAAVKCPASPIHPVDGAPDAVVIEVDPWWSCNAARRSFFTLFMRACATYQSGDLMKALMSYSLANQIMHGIKFFLAGNTTPTFDSSEIGYGIVSKLASVKPEDLHKYLVNFRTA